MESISGKARRHLKALGHHLQPVVLVGKEGVSDALVAAIKRALTDHELIKVKLGENVEGERREVAAALAASSGSELVAMLGRTLLLYKRNPQKAKIVLPDAKGSKAGKGGKTAAKAAEPKKAAGKSKKAAPAVAAAADDDSDASLDEMSDDGDDEGDDDGDFGDED